MKASNYVLRSELPAILGVSRARVWQLLVSGRFPKPRLRTVRGAPLWVLADIEKWDAKRKDGAR
jgi:predicted DNA-binding transcriptional regulator AlpA